MASTKRARAAVGGAAPRRLGRRRTGPRAPAADAEDGGEDAPAAVGAEPSLEYDDHRQSGAPASAAADGDDARLEEALFGATAAPLAGLLRRARPQPPAPLAAAEEVRCAWVSACLYAHQLTQGCDWEQAPPLGFFVDKRPRWHTGDEDDDAEKKAEAQADAAQTRPHAPSRAVWTDPDDAREVVRLADAPRLRKLRSTEEENAVPGAVFEERLRARCDPAAGDSRGGAGRGTWV
jgi:hypothetical protein